jgi:type I restriction enzyme S subunit
MIWPTVAIGEIACLLRNGMSIKQSPGAGGMPITRIETIAFGSVNLSRCGYAGLERKDCSAWLLEHGDILISHINSLAHLGKCAIFEERGCEVVHGMNLLNMRVDQSVAFPRFVLHALRSKRFVAQISTIAKKSVNQASFNISTFKELEIPLPPLEEQRRIAAILDKANQLRQLSQANLQSLGDLLRKVFSDMFGDPVANERGWNSGCIGDFVAQFETGKSLGSGDGDVSDSMRIIRVSAVSSGSFKPEESKPAPKGYVPRENYFVKEGDLLFCRANTDMLIGEVAYVGQGVRDLLLSDKIWRFCWLNKSKSHALYVQQLFRHPSVRREIRRRATGTSGSMLNISQSSVLEIPIILPPADLQNKFQDIAAECRRLFLQNARQAISLRLLSCSLNRSLLEN